MRDKKKKWKRDREWKREIVKNKNLSNSQFSWPRVAKTSQMRAMWPFKKWERERGEMNKKMMCEKNMLVSEMGCKNIE